MLGYFWWYENHSTWPSLHVLLTSLLERTSLVCISAICVICLTHARQTIYFFGWTLSQTLREIAMFSLSIFQILDAVDCKEEKLVVFLDFFLSNCFYWDLLVSCLVVSPINYSKSLIQISYAPRTMESPFFLHVASSCIRNLPAFSPSKMWLGYPFVAQAGLESFVLLS